MAGNSRFKLKPVAAAVLAVLASPLPALGQTSKEPALPEVKVTAPTDNSSFKPDTSSVGGKGEPQLLRDIPQSVTIINRAVMESQGATSLLQVLRNVPGITISAGEGGQIGDNINLRGFSARTDLFLDGMRDRGQVTRDIFALDSVEVLKGPSSMLFGRGSTGGVINQVSKRPSLTPANDVTLGVGTENYRRITADFNKPLSDTSAFRLAAMGYESESTRDVTEIKRAGIAPSLRFGIGTPTDITLFALVQRNRDIPDYGFPFLPVSTAGVGTLRKPVNAPANNYYGYLDDRFNQDLNVLSATINHKLSPTLTLRNQLQFSNYTTDASPTPLGAPPAGFTLSSPLNLINVPRQNRDRKISDNSLYNQTDLIARITAGDMLHTVTTGIELGMDNYKNDTFDWNPTNVTINLGNPVNGYRSGVRFPSRRTNTSTQSIAAYVNDQIDLNKQWKLIAGLRYDRFNADTTDITYNQAGAVLTSNVLGQLDGMPSTRAGLIYQPTETASYYVSYGTSFNPSAEAVAQSTNNFNLEPEKNRSFEVGAKWDLLKGNLSLNTALFRIEKTNARTADPATATLQVTQGEVRVDGFEISTIGRVTQNWQILAGYTFLDGKIVKSNDVGTGLDLGIRAEGKVFPNTPRHTATVWSTYRFAGTWEAGGGAIYSADRYLNNFQTALSDGYTRFDATLAYLEKKYEVRLNVQNLTDKVYFETASGGRATPAEGRRALVTLTYKF